MKVKHLIDLLSELTPGMKCKYVRGEDTCTFVKIDTQEQRLYTKTPLNEDFSFAQSYISALANGIEENIPFNTSQLLNNKGSNRAIIDSIIAHTSEFYWIQDGRSRFTVWIPSTPHKVGELVEWKNIGVLERMKGNNRANLYMPLQQIFFGAPGTGKSYEVKRITKGESVIRTTFHPDSDYSTFVGAYKPTTREVPMRDVTGKVIIENGKAVTENRIIYEFVEQAFLQAYVKAWNFFAQTENGEEPKKQFLIIEEINRGNCAQIFGDLFQLLDRDDNGFSDYPIQADNDMKKQLANAFKDLPYLTTPALGDMSAEETALAIRNGEKLILPSNLYILATMNTSDQSLFPIDSAFKRRWDWQYVPIHDGGKGWMVEADGKHYDWWQFVDTMNNKIGEATYSEDKKLGYFFCKPKDKIIDAETFVGKVIFYIWNDIFKDFADESGSLFKDVDGSMLSFNKFYTIGSDGKRNVVESKISILMQNLGVEPVDDNNDINGKVRYVINGETFKRMSYTGKEIMVKYLSEHKELTFQEIKDKFPDSLLGNVAHRGLIVSTNTSLDSYARYYSPEEFTSSDGITFKIYKQWTINNIDNIVNFAKEQGIDIRVIEE